MLKPLFDRMSREDLQSYATPPEIDMEPIYDELIMLQMEAEQRGIDIQCVLDDYGDDPVTAAYILHTCLKDD